MLTSMHGEMGLEWSVSDGQSRPNISWHPETAGKISTGGPMISIVKYPHFQKVSGVQGGQGGASYTTNHHE